VLFDEKRSARPAVRLSRFYVTLETLFYFRQVKLISPLLHLTNMKLPGTATQPENVYIAMGKLEINRGMTFLDLGCGSGAVSLAASRFTDQIYGIDRRREAVEMSQKKVPGGTFLCGEAWKLIPDLPEIDRCFIGGTNGIETFFPLLMEKAAPGCVMVVNLARIEVTWSVVELMKSYGIFEELLQIGVSRGYELAGDIALRPVNPIFMVVGRCSPGERI
jgi:cobalt-precorrin-6B (C15)-methyltransferase